MVCLSYHMESISTSEGLDAHVALHDYAADILGSKTSIRVLRTLARYGGKVFTVRELSAAAGVSHPQASAVLKELERRGVVRLQPVGKAYQVSLNKESYIVNSLIEPLFAAEKNTRGLPSLGNRAVLR